MLDIKQLDPSVKLIGLTGPARCGKNTIAEIVAGLFATADTEEAYDWIISSESFASPIKSMVAMLLDFFGVASIMNRVQMNEYLESDKKEDVIKEIGMSPRQLMQTLGTDWGRKIVNQDLWLNSMIHRLPQYSEAKNHGHKGAVVIVTDVRFDNEAQIIKALGGTMIYVTTGDRLNDVSVNAHVSEAGVSKEFIDVIIDNSKDLDHLAANVRNLIEMIMGFPLYLPEQEEFGIESEEAVGTPTIIMSPPKDKVENNDDNE